MAVTSLLFLVSLFSITTTALSLNQDGLFLQRVKLGLSDPTGALSSWNDRDPTPCSWNGVYCSPAADGHVTAVDLSNTLLAGPFPSFFCRISTLTSLSLFNNSINSSLPADDISTCRSLQFLDLSQNLLEGPIPDTLADLPDLLHLDLQGNSLTGEIPARFGQFRRLEWISLAGNFLTGTIPSQLGNITTLKQLLLAYNPYSAGPLPAEFGNLTNLDYLWLADCKLEGRIPDSLGRLSKLQNLDLTNNRLTGPIPGSLTQLKSIVQIELYNNSLTGSLPSRGFSNLTKLRRFDASMNELTGTIPDELCGLELGSLNLFENQIEGSLPESIANSPNLYELKLFNNKMNGTLPRQLGLNSPLMRLDVSYNGFSGGIPANLCAKGVLDDLILIYNSFSGRIPEDLGKCRSLGRVRLKNNRLSGPVPEDMWGLPGMYLLELDGNSLTGQISRKVSSAFNLSILLMSRNQFSGSIPVELGFLGNLIEYAASHNQLSGRIPENLAQMGQLGRLVLSSNELSGEFPTGVEGWKSLFELNLANNNLSGQIPGGLGSLPVLNYLDLSGNQFSGKIPTDLQKLKLNLLNLSNNRLSGGLPPMFAKQIYKKSFLGNPGLCGDMEGLCAQKQEPKGMSNLWILRFILVSTALVVIVGVTWFIFKFRSLKKVKAGIVISKWRSFHKLGFSECEILDYLEEDNVIGSGASGKVYKVVLSNGETVAVKKLYGGGQVGKHMDSSAEKDEFEVEVDTLGKIRHKNIVKLWCCCNAADCKLLVYELMPNGSLGDLLHSGKGGRLLDWPMRFKIALDAAEGLSYLHHDCVPPIVHRDVKSNNILLDRDYRARVADFGVAKIVQGVNKGTQSMSGIAGSYGYIAPEYAYTLRVNEKSDIYSFGVVILELVTGRRPIDPEFGEKDLVKWVYSTLDQKGVDQVIDPKLDCSSFRGDICKVLDVGLRCTSSLPISRPSMRRVVKMLQEAGKEMKLGSGKKQGKLAPYYCEEETSDEVDSNSTVGGTR